MDNGLSLKDGNVVVHWHSCENMHELEDRSVHHIVTSPPYYQAKMTETYPSYEHYLSFMKRVLEECYRVLKPGRVLAWNVCDYMIDGKKFAIPAHSIYIAERIGFDFEDDIIWAKPDGMVTVAASNRAGNFIKTGWPLYYKPDNRYEHIIILRKGKLNYKQFKKDTIYGENSKHRHDLFTGWTSDIWQFSTVVASSKNRHPLEYPEELPYHCILFYTLPGELVVDPFTGSGTTAKVAYQMERKFIGYEINPDEKVLADSALTGRMTVPPINRELIKWKVSQPLKIRDKVAARNRLLSDFYQDSREQKTIS